MQFTFFTLSCRDIEAMAAWYRDVVGLEQNCDYGEFKGFITPSGIFFNMVKRDGGLEYVQGVNGTMSIGLGVPNHAEVDIAYNRLIEGGAKPYKQSPKTDGVFRNAYVTDPEGNVICITGVE